MAEQIISVRQEVVEFFCEAYLNAGPTRCNLISTYTGTRSVDVVETAYMHTCRNGHESWLDKRYPLVRYVKSYGNVVAEIYVGEHQ